MLMYIYIILLFTLFPINSNSKGSKSYSGKQGCKGSTLPQLDPGSCQSYFQCIDGVQYQARCAPGMVFSKVTRKCELSAKIPCSANPKTGHPLEGRKCSVNGEIRPSEMDCEKYLLCRVRHYVGMSCPFGLIFSNVKYKCVLPPDHCRTESEYSSQLKEIDNNKQVNNPYIGICDRKLNKTVPEPFDCSMYIFCEEDATDPNNIQPAMSIQECPKGLLFNSEELKCMDPKKVYCGQRYRILTLYGADIQPRQGIRGRSILGRGIMGTGRAPSRSNVDKPRHWVQPGKYKAIPGNTTINNSTGGGSSKNPNGNTSDVVTATINGHTFQMPIQFEAPTPTDKPDSTPSPTPLNPPSREGRSGVRNGRNPNPKTVTITDKFNESTIYELRNLSNSNKPNIIILQVIVNGHHGSGEHDRHYSSSKGFDLTNNSSPPPETEKDLSILNEVIPETTVPTPNLALENSEQPLQPNTNNTKSISEEVNIKRVNDDIPDSLASDEDEPFKFNKSVNGDGVTRAPRKLNILEDYHAIAMGKRLNSRNEDIFYYGDSEYYLDSSENNTENVKESRPEFQEESLELTHHQSRSSGGQKSKLPTPEIKANESNSTSSSESSSSHQTE